MPISINGSGTITGISAGGLPDNCVTAADLATTLDLSSSTITLPSGTGGKILQVVSATKTNVATTTSTSPTAISGFSASITPTVSGSNVLIMVSCAISNGTDNRGTFLYLYKNGSLITGAIGDSTGANRVRCVYKGRKYTVAASDCVGVSYLDSTTGTSSITYAVYFSAESGTTAILGRDADANNFAHLANYPSTITLLEVAA